LIHISTFPVEPRSKGNIEAITTAYLKKFLPEHLARPNVLSVEYLLDTCIPLSHKFKIDLQQALDNGVEGQVIVEEQRIQFTEAGWQNIINAIPRSLFTGCHEAYHVIDHSGQILQALLSGQVRFLAARGASAPITYRNPEWQANHGAGAFLMPAVTLVPFVKGLMQDGAGLFDYIWEIQRAYGVSAKAAETRLVKLGLIENEDL
jgi:hypothetical protein